MKILVHFPTRGRKSQAEDTLRAYISNTERPDLIHIFAACNDAADVPAYAHSHIVSPFRSKIAAYNAVPMDLEWDIVIAASDDMWCIQQGWDTIVRTAMQEHFPNLDGCLWFSDGRQDRICTMSIMGRKAFEADGYIYHQDYLSFFCDNEWTETWAARGKLHKDPRCLFRNEHYAWGGVMGEDPTYKRSTPHWQHDKQLYHERKLKGWPK